MGIDSASPLRVAEGARLECEQSGHGGMDPDGARDWVAAAEAHLEEARALPRPFQRILRVTHSRGTVVVGMDRFVGLTMGSVIDEALGADRVVPLDVWLALVEPWLRVTAGFKCLSLGGRLPYDLSQLGVDLEGRLVLSAGPFNRPLELGPPVPYPVLRTLGFAHNLSRAHVMGQPVHEPSRIFSAATALVELLTGDRPYKRETVVETLRAIATGEKAREWSWSRHPECPEALGLLLTRAIDPQGPGCPTVAAFLELVRAAAAVKPATAERLVSVLAGLAPRALTAAVEEVEKVPGVPASWGGKARVVVDAWLERAISPVDLPAPRQAPARAVPAPRATVVSSSVGEGTRGRAALPAAEGAAAPSRPKPQATRPKPAPVVSGPRQVVSQPPPRFRRLRLAAGFGGLLGAGLFMLKQEVLDPLAAAHAHGVVFYHAGRVVLAPTLVLAGSLGLGAVTLDPRVLHLGSRLKETRHQVAIVAVLFGLGLVLLAWLRWALASVGA